MPQLFGLGEVAHVVGFMQFFNSIKTTISGISVPNFSSKYPETWTWWP